MARAKSGTKMSHVSILDVAVEQAWVDKHYDGLLDTSSRSAVSVTITDDLLADLTDDLAADVTDVVISETDRNEITTISFVGDEEPTPNATVGQFKFT